MLNYDGRIQLINSVVFSITNYLFQCLPVPKRVTKHIEALCRSFLWTSKGIISRKSSVAWSKFCEPKCHGGLNIVDPERWNYACILKVLWNLHNEADNLWVRWVHTYYVKGDQMMNVPINNSCS